jgi:hypothetical protein
MFKKLQLKFIHCLLLPFAIAFVLVVLSILVAFSETAALFFESKGGLSLAVIILGATLLSQLLIFIDLVIKRQYRNVLGLVLGVVLSGSLGLILSALILGTQLSI